MQAMGIDIDRLITWGGAINNVSKKETIFREGTMPLYYFQIITGKVSMYNIDDDGKEFMQGLFSDGESFGEPPLFINEPYPSTALVIKDAVIIKLGKNNFFEMLQTTPPLQMHFINLLATRVFNKSQSSKNLITNDAETRIINFLCSLKRVSVPQKEKILIPYTRQELANMTGLRVETVIRTLAKLQEQQKVKIIDHKLYF